MKRDGIVTYNHAQSNLLCALLLFEGIVQNNVQEDLCVEVSKGMQTLRRISFAYIVSAQDTNDFAAAVQLDKQALVEVL